MHEQDGRKVKIKRDGQLLVEVVGRAEAIAWLHRYQPQSYNWALKYEGYTAEYEDGTPALEPYAER